MATQKPSCRKPGFIYLENYNLLGQLSVTLLLMIGNSGKNVVSVIEELASNSLMLVSPR